MSALRARAVIDLGAIKANIKHIRTLTAAPVMAVVKADAYGHGLIPVAKAAIDAGAEWLGVALLEEAFTLRANGITVPILSWLAPSGSDFNRAKKENIDIAISSLKVLSEIPAGARIHLEVDTGMTRGGFLDEWPQLLKSELSKYEIVGIFSHFARADEPAEAQNQRQLKLFSKYVEDLALLGITPIRHISNSAATLSNKGAHFDLVRCGIAIYGLSPDVKFMGNSEKLGLKPAMRVEAKLQLVKSVPSGSEVGYGATEKTSRDTKVGVVAMGYADGVPRIAHDAGVTHNGKSAPIIGRVSMDQFVVDLGADSDAQTGDWVTVFGDSYSIDDWAKASQTINYEITTRIGIRVVKVYQ